MLYTLPWETLMVQVKQIFFGLPRFRSKFLFGLPRVRSSKHFLDYLVLGQSSFFDYPALRSSKHVLDYLVLGQRFFLDYLVLGQANIAWITSF